VRGVGPYPFASWAKITRREARESSRLSWHFAAAKPAVAIADAKAILGVAPAFGAFAARMSSPAELARTAGEDLALLLAGAPGAPPSIATLPPALARVIGDRVLGGTGGDLAPGPIPLSRAESGLVAYVVARAVAALGGPIRGVIDALPLRDALAALGDARVIVWSAELQVGGARGNVSFVVPLGAIPLGAPPSMPLPALSTRGHVDIGTARLPMGELEAMQIDDVLVPDALTHDPRRGRTGLARLTIARSTRAFELTQEVDGRWVVARALSGASPLPPSHSRRSHVMSEIPSTVPSLADVEVEVAIELARLELPIAEVAALAPGVVVTTGRLVGERVAVRAGERVLAWGELVDVEGEVGVRITELARP
jgi:type III secretion protein Q